MERLSRQDKERQSAAAVIDWTERVVFAVGRADYDAASHAMNYARMHLNVLQALDTKEDIK
ncbi:MAG: hypothetical protein K8H84_07260 [Sulfuricella denitrificans]|nr:hypothetical protein [Sulfuricella denitrificans]